MFNPAKGLFVPLMFLLVLFPALLSSQDVIPRGTVIISHLSPDFGSAADEFVVLYNRGNDTVDLAGHELRYFTASGSSGSAGITFSSATLLPPGRHFLLASRETVIVGSAIALRDAPFTSGMAATGGQLVLRPVAQPDSFIFAAAWGTVNAYLAGMTDAANWAGDGMLSLNWQDSAYARTAYNFSNLQYQHTVVGSISNIPSLNPYVPPPPPTPWYLSISTRQGLSIDSSLFAGMDSAATDRFDPLLDLPAPPPPAGGTLFVGFDRSDLGLPTGELLLRDLKMLRSLADTSTKWLIRVVPGTSGVSVEMVVQVVGLPSALPVQLRDLQNNLVIGRQGDSLVHSFLPTAVDPQLFELWVGDTTPPVVTFVLPSSSSPSIVARSITIQSQVTDGSGIDSSILRFEDMSGSSLTHVLSRIDTQGVVQWLPPRRLLSDSVRFHIDAWDRIGNHQHRASVVFPIVADTARRSFPAGWHLLSTPVDPLNPSWSTVGGAHRSDSVYAYEYSRSRGYYPADSLVPGRGYFLGAMSDRVLTIIGRPAVDTVTLSLTPGFSLISILDGTTRGVNELEFLHGGIVRSYENAVSSGAIASGVFGYDANSASYVIADSVRPWESYWIPVLDSMVVYRMASSPIMNPLRTVPSVVGGWRLRLSIAANGRVDSMLVIGTNVNATDGFDPVFDMPAPPPPPRAEQLRAFIDRSLWDLPTGPYVLRDIRSNVTAPSWTLVLKNDALDEAVISWRIESGVPPSDLELRDELTGDRVDMIHTSILRIAVEGERRLVIRALTTGAPTVSDVPREFVVSQPYPNPFNPQTEFVVDVPVGGRLSANAFDVLGRMVATLFEGEMTAGRHRIKWSPILASGTYIFRLIYYRGEDDPQEIVRRVVLLR